MLLKRFEDLAPEFQNNDVKQYYDLLKNKTGLLILKRVFDIAVSAIMLVLLSPVFLVLAIAIKADSQGPVFYRQERITQFGKTFRIFKFRTMVANADKIGSLVTVNNDSRITKVGAFIRKCRLDEICQLIDIFRGTMSFVGTRPEVKKYVDAYTTEMYATLLLPAGVTSLASINYKDEDRLLSNSEDADSTYINDILPYKMKYNLEYLEKFSFFYDIKLMFMTVFAVLKKDGAEEEKTVVK